MFIGNSLLLTPYSLLLIHGNQTDLLFVLLDIRPEVECGRAGIGDDEYLFCDLAFQRRICDECWSSFDFRDRVVSLSPGAVGNQQPRHCAHGSWTKVAYPLERHSCLPNSVQWSAVAHTTGAIPVGAVLCLFSAGSSRTYDRSSLSFPAFSRRINDGTYTLPTADYQALLQ